MHSPHLTHVRRNRGSGSAPGGRMSFSDARFVDGEMRKNGTAKKAKAEVSRSLRRERSTAGAGSAAARAGKEIAAVGQIAAHVSQ